MRTELSLFHALEITSECKVMFVDRNFIKLPVAFYMTVLVRRF